MSEASILSDMLAAAVLAFLYWILFILCSKVRKIRNRPISKFLASFSLILISIVFVIISFIPRAALFFSLHPARGYMPVVPFIGILSFGVILYGFINCYKKLSGDSGPEHQENNSIKNHG